MQTTPCSPCCVPTTSPVQIPGLNGVGTPGTNGTNAYSTIQAFSCPAQYSNTASLTVSSSAWMVVGEIVVVGAGMAGVGSGGPATFKVISVDSATAVTLEYLAYAGDVGGAIGAGSIISPAGVVAGTTNPIPIGSGGTGVATKVLAQAALGLGQAGQSGAFSGSAVTITTNASNSFASATALSSGTIPLTITTAGLYLITGVVRVKAGATATLTTQTLTVELRKNAAAITNALVLYPFAPLAALGSSGGIIAEIRLVATSVFAASDVLNIYLTMSAVTGAGTIYVDTCNLVAVPLSLS